MKHAWLKQPLWLTIALLLCSLVLAWLAVCGFYISALVMAIATSIVAWLIYRYISRSAHTMAQFIWSVRYSEFLSSPVYDKQSMESLPPELFSEMNEALEQYKQNLQQKESELQYFQALANHIDTAILVYLPDGQIEWINEAARHLLKQDTVRHINELVIFHTELPRKLQTLKAGDISILQVSKEDENCQLVLSGMEFVLQGRRLIVAGMKNIHSVLDNQETEAWQKLIRVLTHEIMNSITPVTSLCELLLQRIDTFSGKEDERDDILQMLQTIRRRGDGLVRFVNGYREVSHIPTPTMQLLTVRDVLDSAFQLMWNDHEDLRIDLSPTSIHIAADQDMLEQVLINLIRNARENEATTIILSAGISSGNRPFIRVEDNGTGIDPDVLERIFIPFFTTKPTGSGIGLTLSRQIMHLHHGNITVSSQLGKGSTFILYFPFIGN